jgi:RNA polymerase sigma-70 factor (ECF subfamily)
MSEPSSPQHLTQQLLCRAVAGEQEAVSALLRHTSERLARLTRHMLGGFARVRRWTETDDVLQNVSVRLLEALARVKPQTPRDFLALASLQIRRELIDLARHFYSQGGIGTHHHTPPPGEQDMPELNAVTAPEDSPESLARWTELHEQIGALPDEEREVVELVFYQGLSQPEAAELLGTSLRTLQRRWHSALCKLHRFWQAD